MKRYKCAEGLAIPLVALVKIHKHVYLVMESDKIRLYVIVPKEVLMIK